MNDKAIYESEFLRKYCGALHSKSAAVFAGAGLSIASGYVDWKTLLRDAFKVLCLDPKKENDLPAIAQYYCNRDGGQKI
jgi:hypothetical protein